MNTKGKKKKILVIKMAILCMAILLIPGIIVSAQTTPDSWINHAATSFAGGNGSQQNPYQIATPEQLAYLSTLANTLGGQVTKDKFYRLEDNLDISAYPWVPIGYGGFSTAPKYEGIFQGYFDGNNKTITGLHINETTDCYAGLFSTIIGPQENKQPIVQNLTIKDARIHISSETIPSTPFTETRVGILAGSIASFANNKDTSFIKNVNVSGVLELNGTGTTGGMAGYGQFITFENCSTDVTINNTYGYNGTGGFLGQCEQAAAINSTSKGAITGNYSLGGFIGVTTSDNKITNCISETTIYGNDWNLGGFVGYNDVSAILENCVAYGDVSSSVAGWKPKVGGFAGSNKGRINQCYAANKVTSVHPTIPAGGFLGYGEPTGTITNSSFDSVKNPTLLAVAENDIPGTNTITKEESKDVLTNVCNNVYGGHDFSTKWTIDTEASCIQEGSKSHHCLRCDSLDSITAIPKTPLTKINAIAATCTTKGNIEYWYCPVDSKYFRDENASDEILEADTITPLIAHTLDKVDAKLPTCIDKGNIEYWYCEVCGDYFANQSATVSISKNSVEIDKMPHVTQHFQTVLATCTTNGNSEYWLCNICGTYFSDSALTTEITKEQTVLPKIPHTTEYVEAVNPTCTTEGNHAYWYCSVCQDYFSNKELTTKISKEQTKTAKIPHTAKYIKATKATCIKEGNLPYWYCSVCQSYFNDASLATKISKEQTKISKIPHTAQYIEEVPATCTKEGILAHWYCDACQYSFNDKELTNKLSKEQTMIAKIPHTAQFVKTVMPTQNTNGNIDYWYCQVCNTYFADEMLTKEIQQADTIIKATGKVENTPTIEVEKSQENTSSKTSTPDTGDTSTIHSLLTMLLSTSIIILLFFVKKPIVINKDK